MGQFSWLTANTNQSITSNEYRHGERPTYLLQPGGQPPIREDDYAGYGMFGDTDAHVWLA